MKKVLSVLALMIATCVLLSGGIYDFDMLFASATEDTVGDNSLVLYDQLLATVVPETQISQQLSALVTQTQNSDQSVLFRNCYVNEVKSLCEIEGEDPHDAGIEVYLIKADSQAYASALMSDLEQLDTVECVEYNARLSMCYAYDGGNVNQWSLDAIGVGEAWDMGFTGSSDIEIAIIDTGVNPYAEIQGNIDYTKAWNFYDDNNNVTDTDGHGTFIAGIIGAANNGTGMSGICQNVTMIPLKVSYPSTVEGDPDFIDVDAVVEAVTYCFEQGVDIINLSTTLSHGMDTMAQVLYRYEGIFVIAAGNGGTDLENDFENAIKLPI